MSKYNKLACKPEAWEFTEKWLARKAPLVYFYGPTGVGKTYSFGRLLEHQLTDGRRPYAPVLYIDGDNGNETIGTLAENEQLCTLWPFDRRYDEKLQWFFDKLLDAEDVECGAIVIEGFNSLYKSMVTPVMRKLSKIAGTEGWQAHNDPSQRMDTMFEAVRELHLNRRHAGKGVPIFVTLNVREVNRVEGDAKSGKMFVPNISPNRIRAAMSTADAFVELTRGSRSKMLVKPDSDNRFRKLRRGEVADKVEAAFDLSLPGLLALWAFESEVARGKLDESLKTVLEEARDTEEVQS